MHRKELVRFAKVLTYVLGLRPDEFGLVPDQEGYLTIKELLQALREESEWSYIGRGHLMELMHSQERSRFEMHEDRMRAAASGPPPEPEPWDPPPTHLYHGIRRRAHPVVLRHGLRPSKGPWVIMALTRELALRIGKRRDAQPVILEVQAREAARSGIRFYRTQGLLALAASVPPEFLVGPPVSPEARRPPPEKPKPQRSEQLPGSFFLDLQRAPDGRQRARQRDGEARRRESRRRKERRDRGK